MQALESGLLGAVSSMKVTTPPLPQEEVKIGISNVSLGRWFPSSQTNPRYVQAPTPHTPEKNSDSRPAQRNKSGSLPSDKSPARRIQGHSKSCLQLVQATEAELVGVTQTPLVPEVSYGRP